MLFGYPFRSGIKEIDEEKSLGAEQDEFGVSPGWVQGPAGDHGKKMIGACQQ